MSTASSLALTTRYETIFPGKKTLGTKRTMMMSESWGCCGSRIGFQADSTAFL